MQALQNLYGGAYAALHTMDCNRQAQSRDREAPWKLAESKGECETPDGDETEADGLPASLEAHAQPNISTIEPNHPATLNLSKKQSPISVQTDSFK